MDVCPKCSQRVNVYEENHGGTVTDLDEVRWHHDCWWSVWGDKPPRLPSSGESKEQGAVPEPA